MAYLPVWLAVACALGAFVGTAEPWVALPALGAGLGASCAVIVAVRRRAARSAVASALAGVAACGAALAGGATTRLVGPEIVRVLEANGQLSSEGQASGGPVELTGRIAADASPFGDATLLRLRAEHLRTGPCGCLQRVEGDVLLTISGDQAAGARASWRAGRRVSVVAALRRPVSYRNPGAPDPHWATVGRRLALTGSVKSALVVHVEGRGPWASEVGAAIRQRAREAIARAARTPDGAAVGTAVLIGDRAGVLPELADRLQRAGTFHVIAISGGNIAMWALLAAWAARRVTKHRGAAILLACVALAGYAALVGGGPSVVRATGMALVGLSTRWLDQRTAGVNVLALTGGLLVAIDPPLIADVGFWLTTLATAGLVVGLPAPRPGESAAGAVFRALVLTSVAAEVALLPVVAAVFQQVTIAGPIASAVAIPAMAVVQVAALAVVVADVVAPWSAGVPGLILDGATAVITESARVVDIFPWLSWKVPPPAAATVVAYFTALGVWLWAGRPWADTRMAALARRWAAAAAVAAGLWTAISPATLLDLAPGTLRLTMLDVGQGDALLIQFPNGLRMLVDAGGGRAGGPDLGARVVGPALRALGVRALDYLVVSHPDHDHLGGAATVLREFGPREVWTGLPVAGHAPLDSLRAAARAHGAAWREVRRGEALDMGEVRLRTWHPDPPDWERQRVRNDDSVVLELRYRDVRIVLTGDIGRDVEAALVAREPAVTTGAPLTILKVAHHGSAGATTSSWVAALRPAVALVSSGPANPFGHPSPEVLERLASVGAEVWRTDRDGAVTLTSDGHGVEVRSVAGRGRWIARQPR